MKYASDWEAIGLELGLAFYELISIRKHNSYQQRNAFRQTLEKWFKMNIDATWKTLEVALTNVNRAKLGLDPVDDIYGKDVY